MALRPGSLGVSSGVPRMLSPRQQECIIRRVGKAAWVVGLIYGLLKLLLVYGTGPLVCYLMVRYLT